GSVVEFYLTISSKRPFEILALSCRDEGQGRVDATAALINRTEDAMIVRFPDNIMLWGATATADREPQQYKIASPEAKHYLVIEPKKTMSLELKAESKTSEPRYPLCHLVGRRLAQCGPKSGRRPILNSQIPCRCRIRIGSQKWTRPSGSITLNGIALARLGLKP